jgi:LEA14-like dessication related protein
MDQKNRNIFIVAAGVVGLIAYSFFRKARTLTNLNFAIKDIPFDLKKKTASVEMRIINPTKNQITLNSVVCDLVFQGDAVGTVKYLKDTIITPQSEVTVRLPIQINPVAVLSLFTTLLNGKQDSIEFKITGTASADNIMLPVDLVYTYDLKKSKK